MVEKKCFWTRTFPVLILFAAFAVKSDAQEQKVKTAGGILARYATHSPGQGTLSAWRSNRKQAYARQLESLPDAVKRQVIQKADEALLYTWPALPAMSFLQFKQNGNRTGFEEKQTERRERLNQLAIGELLTGKGKYFAKLVDGLWATLEESSWEIPAIVALQKIGRDLPDPGDEVVGLVSAETAAVLATIQFMFFDKLNDISPVINKRITVELNRRIFDPYLTRTDYWWMGFTGKPVNNWNAWINTNVLYAALLTVADAPMMTALWSKTLTSTDYFIQTYHPDGGCEEGAAYWDLAGGKLVRMLSLLKSVAVGTIDWSGETLLHNIGNYIYSVHIGGSYFVNFADAAARTIPSPVSVQAYGQLFGDTSLKQFSSYLFHLKQRALPDSNVIEFLETVLVYDSLTKPWPKATPPAFTALPDLQVYTARAPGQTDGRGLFLAIQGGHNGESHNHNDVGNFVLYVDERPVIIDAGVGTYTGKTFSSTRYELWNMQSQWHNCPTINGVMQKEGSGFGAQNVSFADDNNTATVQMGIDGAYPKEAFVQQWNRSFLMDRPKKELTLRDEYRLSKWMAPVKQHFLSHCSIRLLVGNTIGFFNAEGKKVLEMKYEPEKTTAEIEEKKLDDPKLIREWGETLYRLTLTSTGNKRKGQNKFVFTVPEKGAGK